MATSLTARWFYAACVSFAVTLHTTGQEIGFSAVVEKDQVYNHNFRAVVKDWVTSGKPGLFIRGISQDSDTATFYLQQSGVYYVTANIIVKSGKSLYKYSDRVGAYLQTIDDKGLYDRVPISHQTTMTEGERKKLRFSGYFRVNSNHGIVVVLHYQMRLTVKTGSTLSLMYFSEPASFAGVIVRNSYQYLRLKSPHYSADVTEWTKEYGRNIKSMSKGNFILPYDGLYHLIINLNFEPSKRTPLKLSLMIDNTVEAISRTVGPNSVSQNTVNLEGVFNLNASQIITVKVSSLENSTNLYIYSGSKFMVAARNKLSSANPGFSSTYKSAAGEMPEDTWNSLDQWEDNSSPPALRHFGNITLKNGQFIAFKPGIYYTSLALHLSSCSKAAVRFSVKLVNDSQYRLVTSKIHFTSKQCFFQHSLFLKMQQNDQVKIEVKADTKYRVLPETMYQIMYQTAFKQWPSKRFRLRKSFNFPTNRPPVKVSGWSRSSQAPWDGLFFSIAQDNINISLSGLYMVSCNLFVNVSSIRNVQFESQFLVNGQPLNDGSKCRRSHAPEIFTCTMSTLINVLEKDAIGVQVTSNGSSAQSSEILTLSDLRVTLIGNTRSNPTFKLNARSPPYTTTAGKTEVKPLTHFTIPSEDFFQSTAVYSNQEKSFNTGMSKGFFLLSSIQFRLFNDGAEVSSIIGSSRNRLTAYGIERTKGQFSVVASDLTFHEKFNFKVSGKALKSDLKWQPDIGSVSGVYVGDHLSLKALKAFLRVDATKSCSTNWTHVRQWRLSMYMNHLGKITPTGIQISKGGYYISSLNFAIKLNTSDTNVFLGVFVDDELEISAREKSPHDTSSFSMLLHGVLELSADQKIDVRVKCEVASNVTYLNGGGIFAFRVDQNHLLPGLHAKLYTRYSYGYAKFDKLFRYYSQPKVAYSLGTSYSSRLFAVARRGIYLVTMVGYLDLDKKFAMTFIDRANYSYHSPCPFKSNPLYYQDWTVSKTYVALTGFFFLEKDQKFAFGVIDDEGRRKYRWGWRNQIFVHASLQFVGDIETSSGVAATLKEDQALASRRRLEWVSRDTCGEYRTHNISAEFEHYTAQYTGLHVVSLNLVVHHKNSRQFRFCFTINRKGIDILDDTKTLTAGCFDHRLIASNSNGTWETVSNSELLFVREGQTVSFKHDSSIDVSISNQSSFSAFYLGTTGATFGFSSIVTSRVAKLKRVPSKGDGHSSYYYSYDNDKYLLYRVQGWNTSVGKSEMFFHRGFQLSWDDTLICPQDGIYMVMLKLHVSSRSEINSTCTVRAILALDAQTLDFGAQKAITGGTNTLSFTTSLMLKKWQALTVVFGRIRGTCPDDIDVGMGSTLAVVFLGSGKKMYNLWPDLGPHIVEVPPTSLIIRQDKEEFQELKCKAVGKYSISYKWITSSEMLLNNSNTLDVNILNSTHYIKCVATMDKLVVESSLITVTVFDPTVIISDYDDNRTFYVSEKNRTSYESVVTFHAKQKSSDRYRYWYWYWSGNVRCSITKGDPDNAFYFYSWGHYYYYNSREFELRVKPSRLDREKTAEYFVEVTCTNRYYTDAAPAIVTFHVVVLDVNDNFPIFEKDIYNATISSNVQSGEDIIQVMATDEDANENGNITYSLEYTRDSYIFGIDKNSGVISLREREMLTKEFYRLTVEATDHGNPPRSSYVTVVLEVLEFDGSRPRGHPVFEREFFQVYLTRGTKADTLVTTVHAVNPKTLGHGGIQYSLYSGDDSVFKVDQKRGEIKTKVPLRNAQIYRLTIKAVYASTPDEQKGDAQFYNLTDVAVKVLDVNPSFPNFDKRRFEGTVKEDADLGTVVLRLFAVYSKPVNFSIPSTVNPFSIDQTTGMVKVAGKLDYETTKVYVLVASVVDASDETKDDCTDVTIQIEDVNDNAPEFKNYKTVYTVKNLTDGQNYIGRFQATDADSGRNGEIKYYLDSDEVGHFIIDHETGKLYAYGTHCCDKAQFLTIEARDQGSPQKTTTIKITVLASVNPATIVNPPSTVNPPTPVTPPTPLTPTTPVNSSTPLNSLTPVKPAKPEERGGAGGKDKSIDKRNYIIAAVLGGIGLIAFVVGLLFWRRRRRLRSYNATAVSYVNLRTDDDDDLLDVGSDEEENGAVRLSIAPASSKDNLLESAA